MSARVLILGGGFAGLAAIRELSRRSRSGLSVQLVDRRARNVFLPLLPDAISHRISPRHMGVDLRRYCAGLGVRFSRRCVRRIDPTRGLVQTDRGPLRADSILVCLGCETNYFGNRQARKRAIGLRSLEEARRIRTGLLGAAGRSRSRPMFSPHMLVVGGGYTGFETAGQAAYLLHSVLGWDYSSIPTRLPILILEKAPEALSNCSSVVRNRALESIRRLGVGVRTGCTVEEFASDGVVLTDGTEIPRALLTWSAGSTPGEAAGALGTPTVRDGRLDVDEFLRLPGCETVFAAGDVAGPMSHGEPLRMAVQFSLAGGRLAAQNALRALEGRALKPFEPLDLGYVLPLLPGKAAGVILGREMWGRVPSLFHYLMCCLRSWRWDDRLGILVDLLRRGSGDE